MVRLIYENPKNIIIINSLFLLHVWLLTLAAKDASIIITIKKLDDDVCSNTNNLHYDIPFKVLKSQCEDHAGIVSNLQNCQKYAYTIGVIDIDRKPVDKVHIIIFISLIILSI